MLWIVCPLKDERKIPQGRVKDTGNPLPYMEDAQERGVNCVGTGIRYKRGRTEKAGWLVEENCCS